MIDFNRIFRYSKFRWLLVFLFLYGLGVSIATRQVPFSMPDEGAHYLRAYEVSKLHFINSPGSIGVDMPCSEYMVAAVKYNPIAHIQQKAIAEQADTFCKVRTTNTAGTYSFVSYLPAALVLSLIEGLNWSTEDKFTAARVANFSVWFSILFLSLTLLNGGRILMACFMLMPSFFWQLVALSADGATFASCLAYVFLIIRVAQRKQTFTPAMIKLFVALAVFIGSSKGVYAPITLLIFGLWHYLPGRVWVHKLLLFSLPVFAALATFLILTIASDSNLIYLGNNANPELQLAYVLQNPFLFLDLVFKAVGQTDVIGLVAPSYAVPNPGRGFGITFVVIAVLAITMVCSDFEIDKTLRIAAGVLTIIMLVVLSLPLYLTYSPVKFDGILGLQGRYYLPILPLLFITCAFKSSNIDWIGLLRSFQKNIECIVLLAAFALIVAVFNIK